MQRFLAFLLVSGCSAQGSSLVAGERIARESVLPELGVPVPVKRVPLPPEALDMMRALEMDAVVFVVPDPPERTQFAALMECLAWVPESVESNGKNCDSQPDAAIFDALLRVVFAVADAESVGAEDGETIVLLAPDGSKLAGTRSALEWGLGEAIAGLVAAEPFATERATRVAADDVEALTQLFEAGWERLHEPASHGVFGALRIAGPGLPPNDSMKRDTTQKNAYVARHFSGSREREHAIPMIHGVEWEFERYDPCPMCGLHSTPTYGRKFLDFETSQE